MSSRSSENESYGTRMLRQLFLRGKRIFSMQDARMAANLENIPTNQLKIILSKLAKHHQVLRLRRGLYVAIGLLPDKTETPPFVISAFLVQPSSISHWSALQHHGLTEQIPQIITASTPNKIVTPSMRSKNTHPHAKHAWEIDGIRYEYMVLQKNHYNIGLEKIWVTEHFLISITDKERTILDVFISPKLFGGMGEALEILENALPDIDIQKLVGYAVRYGKKSVIKRLGWSLEHLGVTSKVLLPILKIPMNFYCRLDPAKPRLGPCDKHWMIQNNLLRRSNDRTAPKNTK